MKIPESIRIGGIEYAVKDKPDLHENGNLLAGQICYGDSAIYLNPNTQDHQYKCVTLIHETLHALAEHAHIDMGKQSENIIDTFAFGIYQVLQDNGKRLFNIKENDDA